LAIAVCLCFVDPVVAHRQEPRVAAAAERPERARPQVVRCRREEVAGALPAADLAVPLAARLDARALAGAPRLRLILQYGVGLEGVDVPAARAALAS